MIVDDVQRRALADGTWELSARLRDSARIADTRLWFRFSGAEPVGEPVDASPFVVALILAAMRAGEPLVVDAPVSQRLLSHLDDAQRFYRAWYRGRVAQVTVDALGSSLGPGTATAACAFTGGVDSWYTLLRGPADPPVTTALVVASLHNRYDGQERAVRLAALAHQADEHGLVTVLVDTNIVDTLAPLVHQVRIFGPVIVASGLALGASRFLIASSKAIGELTLWNSHPLLDPLWSTERTEVVHHGIEANRIEKVAALAEDGIDWIDVHVCPNGRKNCGRCEKCLRTMVELHLVGVDPGDAFPVPLDPVRIAATRIPRNRVWFWEDIEAELALRRDPRDRRLLLAVRAMLLRDGLRKQARGARRLLSSAVRAVGPQ